MKEKKEKEENEWEERMRGRAWEKCDCGIVMYGKNPFYVLIASGEDVLVARIVHSRVYEKIRETWKTKRRKTLVKS